MKNVLLCMLLLVVSHFNAQEAEIVPNEILVQLADGVKGPDIVNDISSVSITETSLVSNPLNIWLIRLAPSQVSEDRAITLFYDNEKVLVAQKNHKVITRALTPDDNLFDNQWQYFQANDKDIDADEAWQVTKGGVSYYNHDIVAAALDDGHDIIHEDFEDNIWTNEAEIPGNGIDDDNNGYVDDYQGWSIITDDDDISGGGHGTPVAGIIGAKGNNGIGVSGVNWNVKVMVIKNNFNTNEAAVIEAYSYALEARMLFNETNGEEGAFVVSTNASWGVDFGDPEDAPLWCALYDTLGENGILSCGATINGNQNVDVVGDLPTACPSEYMIAVTNTDINDEKVTNAGYGAETIDLGAPGAGAFTTADNNGYGGFGGTSGATPHVTGTIALLYSAPCQELGDLAENDPAAAARVVRDLILQNVDPNPTLEGITTTGGRLNINNAVQALMENCGLLLANESFNPSEVLVNMYPNPTTGLVSVKTTNEIRISNVTVYALDGRKIKEFTSLNNGAFSIEDLPQGAYVVKISFENEASTFNNVVIKK